MKFLFLIAIPLIWALALFSVDFYCSDASWYKTFLRIEIELVKVLFLAGALIAALKFNPGEYLRRAWLFTGGCLLILLIRDITLFIPFDIVILDASLSILANVSGVIGAYMLAKAWRVAGLELPGARWGQIAVQVAALGLALMVAGPAVVLSVRKVAAGDHSALIMFASGFGDIICLYLIAPVLMTALALRGGLLGWPWGLMATSMSCWLFYDAVAVVGPYVGADEGSVKIMAEICRSQACLFGFLAGLAQRFVIEHARKRYAARRE
jgi:hypothetical protein